MIGILEQPRGIIIQDTLNQYFEPVDFSSYGLFYMHAPFRSQYSMDNPGSGHSRPLIIKRSTNTGDWYGVDYDANNTISLESTCRALDAAPNLRLGDVLGVDNWDIVRMYSQLEPNYYHSKQLTNVGKLRFASAGVLESINGVFAPRWLGVKGLESGNSIVKSQMNNGNDFSFISVSLSEGNESFGCLFNTVKTNTDGLTHINDRRTDSRNTYMFPSSPSGFFPADNLQQHNSDNLVVQAFTINGTTKKLKSFFDGEFQNEVTWTGTYRNEAFVLGGAGSTLTANTLTGRMPAILGGSQEWDAQQVADLTDILKTQFNIQ